MSAAWLTNDKGVWELTTDHGRYHLIIGDDGVDIIVNNEYRASAPSVEDAKAMVEEGLV